MILFAIVGALFVGAIIGVIWCKRPALADEATDNHRSMARWIDQIMHDDLVRPLITEQRQTSARTLLAEFYGEEDS